MSKCHKNMTGWTSKRKARISFWVVVSERYELELDKHTVKIIVIYIILFWSRVIYNKTTIVIILIHFTYAFLDFS